LITDCAKYEAADAPETIDADFDHVSGVGDIRWGEQNFRACDISKKAVCPGMEKEGGCIVASEEVSTGFSALHAVQATSWMPLTAQAAAGFFIQKAAVGMG
jgi:hypothetical protein